MHIYLMIEGIYGKAGFVDQTIGTGMAVFGQGYRARIAQQQAVLFICCRDMGMAAEKHRSKGKIRKMIGTVDMAMAHEDTTVMEEEGIVISHDGK